MYATRLLFNPNIPEAVDFKNKLPQFNEANSQTLSHLSEAGQYCLEEDFLKLTARKSIEQLKDCKEEGFSIILATVKHVNKGGDWWYTACKCNRAVTPDSGMYYCDGCYCHVVNVVPRYRIKVRVIDDTDSASFVIFDHDATLLLKKPCSEMLEHLQKNGGMLDYPPDFDDWIEKTFLFKVEVKTTSSSQFEPSFRVRRLSNDMLLIKRFSEAESTFTPKEAIITPGLSITDAIVSTELADVESGIAKDLMSQFCDNEVVLDLLKDNSPPKFTPAKRSSDEDCKVSSGDLSTSKLKEVKIEKD